MEFRELIEAFENLESDINGFEPTVERCRDWASILAGLCGRLAQQTRQMQLSNERRDEYESEQRELGI